MEQNEQTAEQLTELILQNEIEIQKKNQELARRSEMFKQLIEARDALNEQVESAKKKLKALVPEGKFVKQIGDNKLSVNIWKTLRITEGNVNEMAPEYTKEEEIFNVVKRGGRYYQKHGNTTLVKNLVQSGMECPKGFVRKDGQSISIKFNGEAL